jgi:hypothetical protein
MSKNPTPSRAKLIALLIEERAKVLAWKRHHPRVECLPVHTEIDQARREIEAEVLTPTTRSRQ